MPYLFSPSTSVWPLASPRKELLHWSSTLIFVAAAQRNLEITWLWWPMGLVLVSLIVDVMDIGGSLS